MIKDKTFFKFVLSAGTSFLLDLLLFQLFLIIFKNVFPDAYIVISNICARILSSIYNFIINRKLVFKSESKVANDIIKYYILSVSQMLISSFAVHFLCSVIDFYEIVIKLVVDVALFIGSYFIQKKVIFKK